MALGNVQAGPPVSRDVKREWDSDKNEIELYKVRPGTPVIDHGQVAFTVAIGNVEGFRRGQPAMDVLFYFVATVTGIAEDTEAKVRALYPALFT